MTNALIKFLAVILMSFFVGIGFGEGISLKKNIKNDKIKYDRKLTYSGGEAEEIYLINLNSVYYFYLSKENNSIKISPIGTIKTIELTNNKMLK